MRRQFKLATFLTIAHLLIVLFCVAYSYGSAMRAFDDPSVPESRSGEAAAIVASILLLPGRLLWTASASKNLPNILEWCLLVTNSALWGVLATAMWRQLMPATKLRTEY